MKTQDQIMEEEYQARLLSERKRLQQHKLLMQKVSEAEIAHEGTRHDLWIARKNFENFRNGFSTEKEADNETI